MGVGNADRGSGPIDSGLVSDRDGTPGTENVEFLESGSRAVGSAAAAEVQSGVQGPDVTRGDQHIHLAVVVAHRHDGSVVEVAVGTQDACRFLDGVAGVALTGVE